jgi:hypothetical protein
VTGQCGGQGQGWSVESQERKREREREYQIRPWAREGREAASSGAGNTDEGRDAASRRRRCVVRA